MKAPLHSLQLEDPNDPALAQSILEPESIACAARCVQDCDGIESVPEHGGIDSSASTSETSFEKLLLAETPDALIALAPDGAVLYWNFGAEETFGYTREEAAGRSLCELIVPFDRVNEEVAIQRAALETPKGVTRESIRHRQDGSLICVNISTRAVRDAHGQLKCFVSNKKDVTNLKVRRDTKLIEARYRDLLESTPDAIVIVNNTGHIVLVNGQAEAVFGYSRSDLLGKSIEVLLPARYRGGHIGTQSNFFTQPKIRAMSAEFELHCLRKSGAEFPAEISLSPLETEEGMLAMSAIRDITNRKTVEQKFKDLLESAPDAIVIVNTAGKIVLVNSQTEKLFGYPRSDLLEQQIEILIPERLRAHHLGHRGGFFADSKVREMGSSQDLLGRREDGTEFPVEVRLSPLMTEEGALEMSAIRDITDRKRIEESLRKANQMKSEFLANMSHELRTPLNGIIGFTEFLFDEKPGPLNPKQKEYLTDVHQSAQHLLQLINDVLDLAKVEAGKIELNPEVFSPAKAIAEICAVVKGIAQKKSVNISCSVAPELGGVTLDQQKFKQICYNLLANAVKFTGPGGSVEIKASVREGDRFELRVKDTGIGIRKENIERLFREFEQLETGTTRRFEGTGLGLALTKKLVQFQGGSIAVESEYGKGTTFSVVMPTIVREAKGRE